MALAPLAAAADLTAYGLDLTGAPAGQVDRFLAAASEALRQAAGSPISQTTSTVTVTTAGGEYVPLPGPPVTSVAGVEVDGVPTGGWWLAGHSLWRSGGWSAGEPVDVTVTYTHGLPSVPEDIVAQVVVMVASALAASRESDDGTGLAPDLGVASFAIDDYRETAVSSSERPPSPFALPSHVREQLRARFGGGAVVMGGR